MITSTGPKWFPQVYSEKELFVATGKLHVVGSMYKDKTSVL